MQISKSALQTCTRSDDHLDINVVILSLKTLQARTVAGNSLGEGAVYGGDGRDHVYEYAYYVPGLGHVLTSPSLTP